MRGWKKDFSGIEEPMPEAPLTALDHTVVVIFPLFPDTELD